MGQSRKMDSKDDSFCPRLHFDDAKLQRFNWKSSTQSAMLRTNLTTSFVYFCLNPKQALPFEHN